MAHDLHDGVTFSDTTIAGFPASAAHPARPAAGAPPVVFLHGAFADHTGFCGWLHRFADAGFPAIAASRRGRLGVGPARAAGLRFASYVDDTAAVLDTLPGPAVLVGHSLGGLVAQRLAELGRARALVLLASAPPAVLTAQSVALPRFAPQMPRIMAGRPFIVGAGACSALALNQVPPDQRPPIHAQLTHESGKVYRSLMLGTVRIRARNVRVPVFVAGGTEDRIVSPRLVRTTARHYGVPQHSYAGHGHWLIQEPGWQAIANDVLAWLSASLPAGAG
jgi:pimeloyl-ACP methyl ester carboxylesterase